MDFENYFLILDYEIYSIDLFLFILDRDFVEDCGCNGKKDKCKNKWKLEFICLDKFFEFVKDMIL